MTRGRTLRIETAKIFEPLLYPSRYKGAHGGRGSGKSHLFAGLIVEQALLNPGLRAVCIREVQKSLKESAKRLIEDKIAAFGMDSATMRTGLLQSCKPAYQRSKAYVLGTGDNIVPYTGMGDMTSAATVFGHVMLIFVTGPGAAARNSIGWVLVIGMAVGSFFTLFQFGADNRALILIALLTGFLGVCMAAIMTGIVASAFATQVSRKKHAYRAQLMRVLEDGEVTEAESDSLKRLQQQFRLSDHEVQSILDEYHKSKERNA